VALATRTMLNQKPAPKKEEKPEVKETKKKIREIVKVSFNVNEDLKDFENGRKS